jgi:hypothetical protein
MDGFFSSWISQVSTLSLLHLLANYLKFQVWYRYLSGTLHFLERSWKIDLPLETYTWDFSIIWLLESNVKEKNNKKIILSGNDWFARTGAVLILYFFYQVLWTFCKCTIEPRVVGCNKKFNRRRSTVEYDFWRRKWWRCECNGKVQKRLNVYEGRRDWSIHFNYFLYFIREYFYITS